MDASFYESLISSRNASKPKYMAWVRTLLEHAVSLGAVAESMNLAFDLKNAAGAQLETIGELVGLKRLLPFVVSEGTREMSDSEYRTMLQMKIGRNHWDGTNGGALDIYAKTFSEGMRVRYVDNMDGTVDISIDNSSSTREVEILNATENMLTPMGTAQTVSMVGETVEGLYAVGIAVTTEVFHDSVTVS